MATATGDQVVPPTGSLSSANCRFVANQNGVSGDCLHNVVNVTGVSLGLGSPGEEGSRFFFTVAEPGTPVQFQAALNNFDPPTPIGDVLEAFRTGGAYAQLHSESFPMGEIRGRIGPEQP